MKYLAYILFCNFRQFWRSCCLPLSHIVLHTTSFKYDAFLMLAMPSIMEVTKKKNQ